MTQFVQTYTRDAVTFPPKNDWAPRLDDMAHSLSRIVRFNGHGRENLTVAQHCLIVSHLCRSGSPETQLWALLHDAHEAYLGDLSSPLKAAMPTNAACWWADMCGQFDVAIANHAGINLVDVDFALIKEMDELCLAWEARDHLAGGSVDNWGNTIYPFDGLPEERLRVFTADRAEAEFRMAYCDLWEQIDRNRLPPGMAC